MTASKSPDLSEKVSEGGVVGAEPAQVAAQALPINVTVLTTPLYATKMQEDRLADLTGPACPSICTTLRVGHRWLPPAEVG
ncbi:MULTISPECIES: hypothetical protein [unclassified Streptomyces]|uniref:hypothetical protein n=1 Tax=unclassified Streptomyces TaxID=2593676 RepID=UPI000F5501AF|nr:MULTISPECIES: hypothetical protein [unclassified Streptomyces]